MAAFVYNVSDRALESAEQGAFDMRSRRTTMNMANGTVFVAGAVFGMYAPTFAVISLCCAVLLIGLLYKS